MEKDEKFNQIIEKTLAEEANNLKADERIRLAALQALRVKQEKKKGFVLPLVFSYKIPAWMAAAAILLILFLLPSVFKNEIVETGVKKQIAIQDTVYIDRILVDTVEIATNSEPVIKIVYVKQKNEVNSTVNNSSTSNKSHIINRREMEATIALDNPLPKIDFSHPSAGKSLSDDALGKMVLNVGR